MHALMHFGGGDAMAPIPVPIPVPILLVPRRFLCLPGPDLLGFIHFFWASCHDCHLSQQSSCSLVPVSVIMSPFSFSCRMSQTRLFGSSVLFFSANIDRGLSIFFFSKKPAFHLLVWVGVGSLSHLPLHSALLFQFLELHCCLSEIFGGFWGVTKYWNLNSGLCSCLAGALPLDPQVWPFLLQFIFQIGSGVFAQPGL
jgi:hypothetical protein